MLLAYPLEQFTFNSGKTKSKLTHTNETNVSSLHAYMRNLEGHVFICAYLHANLCMFCVSFMVNVHLSSTLHAQCNKQIKHQLLMLELFPIFLRHTTCTGSWVTSRQLLRPNNQSDLANLHCTFRNRKSIITTDRNQPVFLSRFYKISPSWDQFSRDLKFRIVFSRKTIITSGGDMTPVAREGHLDLTASLF